MDDIDHSSFFLTLRRLLGGNCCVLLQRARHRASPSLPGWQQCRQCGALQTASGIMVYMVSRRVWARVRVRGCDRLRLEFGLRLGFVIGSWLGFVLESGFVMRLGLGLDEGYLKLYGVFQIVSGLVVYIMILRNLLYNCVRLI